ncbi:DUF7322 domain-containing protein [Haloarchaeobius amylolyticus]|uniref:DUF7322 domain-containing protein n=1 Tax=Haloarchaeobius amylolyticus TaxID=1198296 RepID=UPI00226F85BC|nr:hypothetical protein [Haloarchaeobius amylolyticus]
MFNERSEHEPEEYDPEEDLRDYEGEFTPSVRVPRAPEAPSVPDESDAPSELKYEFWTMVLVFNAAILGVSLGGMYILFRGNWDLGGRIFLGGVVFFLYGLYRYQTRTFGRDDDDGTDEDGTAGDDVDDGTEVTADAATTETEPDGSAADND